MNTTLQTAEIDTPLGPLTLALRGETLCAAAFSDGWARLAPGLARRFGGEAPRRDAAPARVRERFEAYFAGELDALEALAVDPGGTPFQARVWAALRRVPAGHTVSYTELAAAAGVPGKSRAVGAANGANPVWIAIPCHRVIGADGSPRGYAGGVPRKLWLLGHEGARRLVITLPDLHLLGAVATP